MRDTLRLLLLLMGNVLRLRLLTGDVLRIRLLTGDILRLLLLTGDILRLRLLMGKALRLPHCLRRTIRLRSCDLRCNNRVPLENLAVLLILGKRHEPHQPLHRFFVVELVDGLGGIVALTSGFNVKFPTAAVGFILSVPFFKNSPFSVGPNPPSPPSSP